MPDSAAPSQRNVWVVLFDQLPLDPVGLSGGASHIMGGIEQLSLPAPLGFTPFDDLDQTSIFFEQYLIQDIRASASVADTLGGSTLVRQFEQQLEESGCSINCRRLVCAEAASALHLPSTKPFLFEHSTIAQCSEAIVPVAEDTISPVTLDAAMSDLAFDSSLIWIDVDMETVASDQRIHWSGLVLDWLLNKLADQESSTGTRPILIVSAQCGLHMQIQAPFTTMGDESLVHVPLWIDDGSRHACRIQRLAGSFDLLPTISHYLTGHAHDEQKHPTPATQASVALSDLNSKPTSLIQFLRSSEFPPDRLLKLTADAWTGLRTQQYLLIHPEATVDTQSPDSANDSSDFAPARTRGLYLKPDDLWNVQNSIVAYEAIADEMEHVISKVRQEPGESRFAPNIGSSAVQDFSASTDSNGST